MPPKAIPQHIDINDISILLDAYSNARVALEAIANKEYCLGSPEKYAAWTIQRLDVIWSGLDIVSA